MGRKWNFAFEDSTVQTADPPGFIARFQSTDGEASSSSKGESSNLAEIKNKKLWETAWSPGQSLIMTALMLWMSGSGVNIFSVLFTSMTLFNSLKACMTVNNAFQRFEDGTTSLLAPKALYVAVQSVGFWMALYKCSVLGFLPTSPSDWLGLLSVKEQAEMSLGGFVR